MSSRLTGPLVRLRAAGVAAPMLLLLRVPARVRVPVARPMAGTAERAALRRPSSRLLPLLAFAARAAAGSPGEAAALALRVGTSPACRPATRRGLVRLAVAARQEAAAKAIVAAVPDDLAPELEAVRARAAYEAGRYAEALVHARRAAAGGSPTARRLEAVIGGQLTALGPGWLPDLGAGRARLAAGRGSAVRGRVLHLVSSSLPYRTAGYNVRTRAVAACQREAGLDPHVAVRAGFPRAAALAGEPRRRQLDGIDTWWYGPDEAGDDPLDRHLAAAARLAIPLVEELRPAVLQPASNHLQAQVALSLAAPLAIPVVYEARGFWEETWLSRTDDETAALTTDLYRMTRDAETAAMRASDAVVTLSGVMRDAIIERGCTPDRVVVVPNAVDPESFVPSARDDALGASLGIGRDDPVVGYVTSLNPYEGIPYLLAAAARLRPQFAGLRVLLVGDGEEAPVIREAARRLGLEDGALVMPGRVPHEQVTRYYSLIDVFVVPRTTHRVSRLVTPLKPYEAMALERAVVVSDLPALREIVEPGETGMAFRAEDADDLAEVLGRLLDDPGLRRRLGRQARAWILAERTWAANGRRYRELFERLGVA